MGVSVDSKHGHRLPGAGERPSLLGGGLLERARSTTLALLGVTAAVGLAMVALALNQGWPLVAGSAIPAPPHLGVGKAAVVAATSPRLIPATGAVAPPSSAHSRDAASRSGGSPNGGSAGGSADFVVSPSSPVSGEHSGTGRQVPVGNPRPAPPQSEQAAATPAAQPAPAPAQTTPPAATPAASGATTPPPQTAEAPPEEEPEEESPEEDEQGEEESEDWHGGWHGHGRDHGHHWGWGD